MTKTLEAFAMVLEANTNETLTNPDNPVYITLMTKSAREILSDLRKLKAHADRLAFTLKGGNALKGNAEMLEFLSNQLVEMGQKADQDVHHEARSRAAMIRSALDEFHHFKNQDPSWEKPPECNRFPISRSF